VGFLAERLHHARTHDALQHGTEQCPYSLTSPSESASIHRHRGPSLTPRSLLAVCSSLHVQLEPPCVIGKACCMCTRGGSRAPIQATSEWLQTTCVARSPSSPLQQKETRETPACMMPIQMPTTQPDRYYDDNCDDAAPRRTHLIQTI
jgi:hypothetical protein